MIPSVQKSQSVIVGMMLGLFLLGTAGPATAGQKKKLAETEYDLSNRTISGERARGPRRIIARNLNPLRYDYKWGSAITYTAAPDLWSKLLAASAAPFETPKGGPAGVSGETKSTAFGKSQMELCKENEGKIVSALSSELVEPYCDAQLLIEETNRKNEDMRRLKTRIVTAQETAEKLIRQTQEAVGRANLAGQQLTQTLRGNSSVPQGILTDIDLLLRDDSPFMAGVQAHWLKNAQGAEDFTDVDSLRSDAEALKKEIDDEKSNFPKFMTDRTARLAIVQTDLQERAINQNRNSANRSAFEALGEMIKNLNTAKNDLGEDSMLLDWAGRETDKILATIPNLEEGGEKYRAFAEAREKLVFWKLRMANIRSPRQEKEDPFKSSIDEFCGFVFGGEKRNTVTLTRIDLMPGGSTNPEQVLRVEIICSSPLTISAGVAFSTIPQEEFAIRAVPPPGGGTPVNSFVLTSSSRFHPMPVGMFHARFYEPNETLALHAGFGIAGNLRSQSAGGSDAEFLFGVSFSLFRTMFITPGLHVGRQVDLGPGYKVGDPALSITEPPLTKSYKAGFGLAITFAKP